MITTSEELIKELEKMEIDEKKMSEERGTLTGEEVRCEKDEKGIMSGLDGMAYEIPDPGFWGATLAAEKELDDKWKKIDEVIQKKFGPIEKPNKIFHHFSQVKQIYVNELSLDNLEKGQHLNDSVQKKRIAKIYRNGKDICVVAEHSQFAEAKREEKQRIKQEKKQAALEAKKLKQKKEQAAIVAKPQAVKDATEISEKKLVVVEDQDEKPHKEPQQKRNFRYKLHSKIKLDFSDEEMEEYTPKQSITLTQTSKPSVVHEEFKVDPIKNFHGEPIVPKEGPIDWESLPIPELNLSIFNKEKKTKIRAIKKIKPGTLRTKT
ncbi:hypothetical protein AgCh_021929 [Apium graveolens]